MSRRVFANDGEPLESARQSPKFFDSQGVSDQGSKFDPWLSQFRQLVLNLSESERTFYCGFNPKGRACFNLDLLRDLRQMQNNISGHAGRLVAPRAGVDFDFMVVRSETPDVYNLGGDLALFRTLVKDRDGDALRAYAQLCVDVVRDNEQSYGSPIMTIAQVEGSCLGGGFEAALSCDVIIAERHVKFGFPEILFGLFPGMGAINFLTRRVSKKHVVDLILSGRTFTAEALLELGLVDQVVDTGQSGAAVARYIHRNRKSCRSHAAVHGSIRACRLYTDEEFRHIIDQWVSVAMRLTEKDLNKMLRLADAQDRKHSQGRESGMAENPRSKFQRIEEVVGQPS